MSDVTSKSVTARTPLAKEVLSKTLVNSEAARAEFYADILKAFEKLGVDVKNNAVLNELGIGKGIIDKIASTVVLTVIN